MRKTGKIFRFLLPVIALATLVVFMTGAGRRERATLEKNKAIVRRAIDEFWNKGDIAAMDKLFATNYVNHDPRVPDRRDLEGLKQWAKALFAAFPDLHVTIEDMIAEGDKVTKRYTTRYTWTGEFMGMSPTGTKATTNGTSIYRIADGKIVEMWWSEDSLGPLLQHGFKLVPPEEKGKK